jgi:hypothetical protein
VRLRGSVSKRLTTTSKLGDASDSLPTGFGDILARLDLGMFAKGQAQNLGAVLLNQGQGRLYAVIGRHDEGRMADVTGDQCCIPPGGKGK